MQINFKELDVRPILRSGGEPFPAIMETLDALGVNEGLRLVATFRPTPLLSVMARRGYSAEVNEIGNGDWEVLFSPIKQAGPAVSISLGAEEAAGWPDPIWHIDLSGMEPPGPMEKVLSLLKLMEPGEVLFALFSQEPNFLRPELEKRGHQWAGSSDNKAGSYRMFIRAGGDI